jgi:hypothetical protein
VAHEYVTAALLAPNGNVVERRRVEKANGQLPQQLTRHVREHGLSLIEVYRRQPSTTHDDATFIWYWTEAIDSGRRIRSNPNVRIDDPSSGDEFGLSGAS